MREFEVDPLSKERIDQALKTVKESSAGSKLAFSSYTHAAFDQESRILTGDIRWKSFAVRAGELGCRLFPLTWEMQPPGILNDLKFLVPVRDDILKTKIRSGTAMMRWWSPVTPQVQAALDTGVLSKARWVAARDFVVKQTASEYPSLVAKKVAERFDFLQEIYFKLWSEANGKRLSEVSEEVYQVLVKRIFGDSVQAFSVDRKSYFGSEFGNRVAKRAVEGLKDGQLEKLIGDLHLSHQNIFVGGEWGAPITVYYDSSNNGFTARDIDVKTGQPWGLGRKLDTQELIELLERSSVRPTGKLFDVLLLHGRDELVVHDGNDYGIPASLRTELPNNGLEYHKLFCEYGDSFTPIEFVANNGLVKEPASLASLFLWNLEPGFWLEKLKEAVKTDRVQSIDVAREVAKC